MFSLSSQYSETWFILQQNIKQDSPSFKGLKTLLWRQFNVMCVCVLCVSVPFVCERERECVCVSKAIIFSLAILACICLYLFHCFFVCLYLWQRYHRACVHYLFFSFKMPIWFSWKKSVNKSTIKWKKLNSETFFE